MSIAATTRRKASGSSSRSTKSSSSPRLIDQLAPRQHYLRAAHIEHHEGQTAAGYIPTARGLEVVHRVMRAMTQSEAGRAWSLTGPYGAGKSSFGLFLHALLGPTTEAAHAVAMESLTSAEPELASELTAAREQLHVGELGFLRAAATAQREPITDTLLRALSTAAKAEWPSKMPADIRRALAAASADRTPRALSLALQALAERRPVLLIIDEFGKNLEHFADHAATADLFVLQELAECCSGPDAVPAFILTLQHLAFDDYVRTADVVQRREWGKIQGRFEDIPFIDGAEQAARLASAALVETSLASDSFRRGRRGWASAQAKICTELGIHSMIAGGKDTIAACYPLHPLTLLTLPDMCAKFGQHGRTLFSFLTGREPHSVVEFLERTDVGTPLPSVGIDQLYDFFLNSPGGAGASQSRLLEIDATIRETTGLLPEERQVLKIVGVLNLLSQGGPLRASRRVIEYATSAGTKASDTEQIIAALEQRGLLTYRGFADEYRIWRGSDLDLRAIVGEAREQLSHASPAALLASEHKMPPAIAGGHSQRVGMLRYFETTFADPTVRTIRRPEVADDADGLVIYHLGPPETAAQLSLSAGSKPVLLATTTHHEVLVQAIVELAAVQHALTREDVRADHVARRELQERAADARRRLAEHVACHLRPDADGVSFQFVAANGAMVPLPAAHGLSPLLSAVCDRVYSASPEIRNEMLGRRELTSQAAKARRELLEAMVAHGEVEWLGFTGFGPEKAMYAALLRHTEIHTNLGGGFAFDAPHGRHAGMAIAWRTAEGIIREATDKPIGLDAVYAALMRPPIGLKEGAIPVLLTALLLAHGEDIALYQEGTYQPVITADLLERLVKSPARFSARHFSTQGGHARVIAAVAAAVETVTGRQINPPAPGARARSNGRRNTALLSVVSPLLTFARGLPEYTLRTHRLASYAEAVRDALMTSREPDHLLFEALPQACGLEAFRPGARGRTEDIAMLEERLTAALEELGGSYADMLYEISEDLSAELRLSEAVPDLRTELRGQATPLTETLLEPRLRSFVLLAGQGELDDTAWLEAVGNNIAGKPPATWRDEDVARFDVELRAIAAAYRRVLALHYDAVSAARAGFDAHRVTMTNPDGTEHSSVVWVDHAAKAHVQSIVARARAEAEKLLGTNGGEALLALLTETVLAQEEHPGKAMIGKEDVICDGPADISPDSKDVHYA